MRLPALLRSTPTAIALMIASCLVFSQPGRMLSQQPPPTVAKAPDYSAESIVIERADTVYSFGADGTGTEDRTIVARVQTDAAVRALGVVSVAFASDSQRVEFLYARVRHPDGSVVDSTPTDAIEMPQPVTRDAPFYSDLKEKQLPIRSLRVGDTLEWKARITTTKSQAPGQFWGQDSFADDTVVLAESIELRVPAGIYVNVWSPTSKPVESDTAATGTGAALHVYRWTSSQLKPTAGKEAEAEAEAKKKMVWTADQELDADQGKLPTIAWTTFKSWEDVGAWYRTLEADRTTPSPEIKAKVAELIAGKTTDEEKVRALYAYVSTQIRYIGVAFGVGRYQPHTASEILANQYGDCKDKHTLLAAMLSAAGIQSDAVLIGAGIRFNPGVPSPDAFNHLITHLSLSPTPGEPAQPVWLDTTAEIAPYRMLVSVIRDKQALVIPATGTNHLDRTPADPPFPTFETMDAVGSIDQNGTSHSRLTLIVRGDSELAVRAAFHSVSPGQYNDTLQQISYGIGYAGTTSNPDITRPDDTSVPFQMSYDYEREKAGDWGDLKIVPQIAPVDLPRFADSDPLVRSLDLGTPRVETSKAAMKIPDGWSAILPEAAHYKCAYATYDETYRFDKGTIYTERRIEVLQQKVPTADLKTYKKWANDADLGNELYIQLIRHDPGSTISISVAPSAGDVPTPANPGTDVQKLIQQAYADIDKMDLYNAKELLDQARKLSPDHEFLWNTTGYWELRNGQTNAALADYKKELSLHPADFKRMYPVILKLQLALGQRSDALDSMRAWSKADTSNPKPVEGLINMLIEDGNFKTAVSEGEAAFQHLPDAADRSNDAARIALGKAYLLADERQRGETALTTVLNNSQDSGLLNDAAYDLADASLDLPLDETSARTALAKLGTESGAWTLDEDPQILNSKSHLIVATWDTLGWILFRESKLDEAKLNLQAAWANQPSLDIGEHLGDILAARGEKSAALTAYLEAAGSAPAYDALGVRTAPSERQKKVQALADGLKKSGVRTAVPYSNSSLLLLRTVKLGPARGRTGDAEYRLLIRAGKAVKVEPAGAKSVPGAEDLLMKADFNRFFPQGSQAALVRAGYVNCDSGTCELVLEP